MPEIIRIGGRTYKEVKTRKKKTPRYSKEKRYGGIFQNPRQRRNMYADKLDAMKQRRAYESEKSRFRQEQRIRRQQASARRKEKLERYKQKAKAFYNKDVGNPLNRFRKKKEQQPYGGFESAEK